MPDILTIEERQAVDQFLQSVVDSIKQRFESEGISASGRTANSLQVEPTINGGKITGALHIEALVKGRQPTREGAPRGNPTLVEAIKAWMGHKGITGISPYAIANAIHRDGFEARPNLLNNIIDQNRLNAFLGTFAQSKGQELLSGLLTKFK